VLVKTLREILHFVQDNKAGRSEIAKLAARVNVFSCVCALLFSRHGSGSLWNVAGRRNAPVVITLDVKLTGAIRA
jgi:hypothetical protein